MDATSVACAEGLDKLIVTLGEKHNGTWKISCRILP